MKLYFPKYIDKVVIIEIKQTYHTVWLHWGDISICWPPLKTWIQPLPDPDIKQKNPRGHEYQTTPGYDHCITTDKHRHIQKRKTPWRKPEGISRNWYRYFQKLIQCASIYIVTDFNVQTFLITNMDHIREDNTILLADLRLESERTMDTLRKLAWDETHAAEIVEVMETHLKQV